MIRLKALEQLVKRARFVTTVVQYVGTNVFLHLNSTHVKTNTTKAVGHIPISIVEIKTKVKVQTHEKLT